MPKFSQSRSRGGSHLTGSQTRPPSIPPRPANESPLRPPRRSTSWPRWLRQSKIKGLCLVTSHASPRILCSITRCPPLSCGPSNRRRRCAVQLQRSLHKMPMADIRRVSAASAREACSCCGSLAQSPSCCGTHAPLPRRYRRIASFAILVASWLCGRFPSSAISAHRQSAVPRHMIKTRGARLLEAVEPV